MYKKPIRLIYAVFDEDKKEIYAYLLLLIVRRGSTCGRTRDLIMFFP